MFVVAIMIVIFNSISTYVDAFVDDLTTMMQDIDQKAESVKHDDTRFKENQLKLRISIFELVKMHNEILW